MQVNTQRKLCTSGLTIFNWDGTSNSGEQLKNGFYTFIIKNKQEKIKGKISLMQ